MKFKVWVEQRHHVLIGEFDAKNEKDAFKQAEKTYPYNILANDIAMSGIYDTYAVESASANGDSSPETTKEIKS